MAQYYDTTATQRPEEANNFDNSPIGDVFAPKGAVDAQGNLGFSSLIDAQGRGMNDPGFDAATAHFAPMANGNGYGGVPGGVPTGGLLGATPTPSVAAPISTVGTSGNLGLASGIWHGVTPPVTTAMSAATASLLGTGVSSATGIIGALIAANASGNASDKQAAAAQAALDFLKSQKAKQETAAAPYLSLGQMATSALPGAVRPSPTGGPPAPYNVAPGSVPSPQGYSNLSGLGNPGAYGQGPSQQATPSPVTAPPAQGAPTGPMVLLQAPDGTQKSVPAGIAPQYIAKGAKAIG